MKPKNSKDHNVQDNMVKIEVGSEADTSELTVRKCYYQWINHNKVFKPQLAGEQHKSRDIQKDSLRCYLIYIPFIIKKLLVEIVKEESYDTDKVGTFLIYKIMLLHLGSRMLVNED